MFKTNLKPRIAETNRAGHISNTVIPTWLEEGRYDFLENLLPNIRFRHMLVRLEQDFKKEIYPRIDVLITTTLDKIGNSSLAFKQKIWQEGILCHQSISILAHFDAETGKTISIPEQMRTLFTGAINSTHPL